MLATTLRTWMAALLTLLLAGQQLACACISHRAAAATGTSAQTHHDPHAHHASADHAGHQPAREHGHQSPAGCEHCDHSGLSAVASVEVDAAHSSEAPSLSPPALLVSELAWRLPAKSRERPPPSDSDPPFPAPLGKTRLLI